MFRKSPNKILIFFIGFIGTFSLFALRRVVVDIYNLNNNRVMAMRANRLINNEKSNYALITAIASSHITTAFEHANQTSVFYHAHEIDKNMQSNWYNYSFDGETAWDRNRQTNSFSYLKNVYDKVFYWSTRGQLKLYEDGSSTVANLIAPRAQLKVLVGRSKPWRNHLNGGDWPEILGELEAYEVFSFKHEANNKLDYGFKNTPLESNCNVAKYCFIFTPKNKTFHNLNSIALWFKDEINVPYSKESQRTQRIQKLWKLQGLRKDGKWEDLVFKFDDTLVARDSGWVFSIDTQKAYSNFRFLADDPDDFLTEMRLYAKYKKSKETRVFPSSIFLSEYNQSNKEISLIPKSMEQAKNQIPLNIQSKQKDYTSSFLEHPISKLPIGIEMYFRNPKVVTRYELNASKYGIISAVRMPKKWVFQGYDPRRKKWIDLHSVQNSQNWAPSEKRNFNFVNKEKYPIYRLHVTELNTNRNIIRIGELKMFNENS